MTRPPSIPPAHSLTIAIVCFVLALICFGLLLSGCSSPTAPTSIFHWDLIAPGCSPTLPLPNVSGEPTIIVQNPTNDLAKQGFWVVEGRTDLANGTFVKSGPFYLLCSWKWGV